jgi:lysophospholipase L1-like esterase
MAGGLTLGARRFQPTLALRAARAAGIGAVVCSHGARGGVLLVLLLAVLLALGCARARRPVHVVCLGDSITLGTVRGDDPAGPPAVDARGGWPGRLEARLGGAVRVTTRAAGGATTALWLSAPDTPMGTLLWAALRRRDATLPATPPPACATVADAVLGLDRPDVVVLLLGANDLHLFAAAGGAALVDEIAARLDALARAAAAAGATVLVGTVLPSRRDPPALREALNARIRAAHPDHLPLAERFAGAGGERLLDDEVHPSEAGYDVVAAVVAEALVGRRLVRAR